MQHTDIEKIRAELMRSYPGCHVKVAEDQREIVAEISDGFAVASSNAACRIFTSVCARYTGCCAVRCA